MPYKSPEKQRNFQKKWIAKRRADHFKGKKCASCGKEVSSKTADLDHKKAKMNRTGHKIWSREKKDRSKEIKKTQILCKACHKRKTAKQAAARAEDIINNSWFIGNNPIDEIIDRVVKSRKK
jgi:5-methylcytosine-specific restriction endonuclease McrA